MASAAPGSEIDTDDDGDTDADPLAPTDRGRQSLISEQCRFDGHTDARNFKRRNVAALYGALVRHEGAIPTWDLRRYFRGYSSSEPKQGLYTGSEYAAFMESVGGPALLALPGIEENDDGDGFRFVGLTPGAHDLGPEHTRPLGAYRADPRIRARNALDRLEEPYTDAHEDLLTLWDMVAEAGETTTDELERDYRTPDLGTYGDRLADLPHIVREIEGPPSPDDLSVETYEDVLEAKRRFEAEPSEVWRFDPEPDGS